MTKIYLKLIFASLLAIFSISNEAYAAKSIIKATTSAPAGTSLRIYPYPYDTTISGADPEGHFGMYISKGEGSEITISAEGLSQLEIYGCQLTKLEIVSAPDLFILKCYNNKLEALDLSTCGKLEVLDCHNNCIEKLDVGDNPLLSTLDVSQNQITNLELGSQKVLTEFNCSNNPLSTLNVTSCAELTDLYFQNCQLNTLDLSKNSKLEWVFAYNNDIAGENMTNFIANMPAARTTGLIYIVDTRADTESNVCTMENVRAFAEKGWATMDYLGGARTETQLGKFYPGCDYVPTVSDRKISLTTSRQPGDKITLNIKSTANITISGVEEAATSGKLTYTLTSPTVEILGDVTSFECPDNQITELKFSDPSLITYIDCRNNSIQSLTLTGAKSLTQLYCQNNDLTSLNLEGCTSLMRIDCFKNQLKGKGMKNFMNSLYQATNEPYLFVIDTKADGESEGNIATTTDVKIATDKGWEVYDYANGANYGFGIEYKGSEPTEPELPEQYFTITRSTKGYIMFNVVFSDSDYTPIIEGGTLSGWNGTGLTINMNEETIKVYGDALTIQALFANIEDIDLTMEPNLTELNIALNDITELTLTNNPNLTTLSCECNLLTTLDLSTCPNIDFINCYGNQIKGDGMTEMINSLPMRSRNSAGQLIVYDPTYPYEGNVCLKSDVQNARAKYWLTYQLTADGTEAIIYEGEDPTGIENIETDIHICYNADEETISLSTPGLIEVYATTGRLIMRAANATSLSIASQPSGIYVIRSGNRIIKVTK